tara:strand:- start:1364 stop:2101 length:738 start_codon:yes stop_codon:yes gene_type:complete
LTSPIDNTIQLYKRSGDKIYTTSPKLLKKISERGHQKGHIILTHNHKFEDKEKRDKNGLLWLENNSWAGRFTLAEIRLGFDYAIRIAEITNKTLYIRYRPGDGMSKDEKYKNYYRSMISKSSAKIIITDESIPLIEISKKCDSMIWTFGSVLYKLLPYIPLVYIQNKPNKFAIENSESLSLIHGYKGLRDIWGYKTPEEATKSYRNNHNNIREVIEQWRQITLDSIASNTSDLDQLKDSWLQMIS